MSDSPKNSAEPRGSGRRIAYGDLRRFRVTHPTIGVHPPQEPRLRSSRPAQHPSGGSPHRRPDARPVVLSRDIRPPASSAPNGRPGPLGHPHGAGKPYSRIGTHTHPAGALRFVPVKRTPRTTGATESAARVFAPATAPVNEPKNIAETNCRPNTGRIPEQRHFRSPFHESTTGLLPATPARRTRRRTPTPAGKPLRAGREHPAPPSPAASATGKHRSQHDHDHRDQCVSI